MPRTSIISRIPAVSRIVVMMAAALLAVSALTGLPVAGSESGAGYSTTAYSTTAFSTGGSPSDTSPATPLSTNKCKKKCKKRYDVRHSDLKNLSDRDLESVATLGTVLAVIALAAVI